MQTTLDGFIAAFNSGSSNLSEPVISRYAQWFSLTLPSGNEVAYGQNGMASHLIERHRAGDRLEDPRIRVTALVGWEGSAHFEVTAMQLTRGGSTLQIRGKGALQCRGWGEGIVVLSLGTA